MSDEELIARLRHGGRIVQGNYAAFAADRIEALVKQLAEADALIEAQAKDHASNNIRLAETAHRAERLEAALRAWTETIATVMPKDFKSWHQNSPDEWPLVTVRVIKSLREQLDLFLD